MKKVLVVYWTQSGNTQMMADQVAEGAKNAGADVTETSLSDFDASTIANYDAYAFGCPAMGSENLEEGEFQPFWDEVKTQLGDKKVGLFGSYGWGVGDWMTSWAEDARNNNVNLVNDGVIANYAPDDDANSKAQELGAQLAA